MKQTVESHDPSNDDVLGEVQRASKVTMLKLVERAKILGALWRRVSPEGRLTTLQNAYSAVESSLDRLSELLSKEMGEDIRQSTSEVQGTIWGGPYIAKSSLNALRSRNSCCVKPTTSVYWSSNCQGVDIGWTLLIS